MLSEADLLNLQNLAKTRQDTKLNLVVNEYRKLLKDHVQCTSVRSTLEREKRKQEEIIAKLRADINSMMNRARAISPAY